MHTFRKNIFRKGSVAGGRGCGGVVVWWCGGVVVWWCGFFTDYNTTLRLHWVTLGCGNMEEKDANIMMLENVNKSKELELKSFRREYESVDPAVSESSESNDCFTSVQNNFMFNEHEASTSACNKFENEVDKEKYTLANLTETTTVIEIYNCDECDFVCEVQKDQRVHIKLKHEAQCENCKEMFVGMHNIKNHMCRIFLKNPTSGDFYTKNWYLNNDCLRIISKQQQK